MFTGIVEATGIITNITSAGTNKTFWIKSPISSELRIDQSISHSGVCLTVEEIADNSHRVTAIEETLSKTNLGDWKEGDLVNLERCMILNGRLDGHIVQGHVDATAICVYKKNMNGSWEFGFEFNKDFGALVIEKGSVSLNGISLTIYNVGRNSFSIGIIPYTFEHTNIKQCQSGDKVNLEFDLIGKYIKRMSDLKI